MTLHLQGLTKSYAGTPALTDVSMALEPGRVHALMGENGAGKSTFIKLLAGVERADAMRIERDGTEVPLRSPADAHAAGFRFIHQELTIVPELSVAENILLGHRPPSLLGFVRWRALAARARAALEELGVAHIDVRRHAGSLRTGDRMLMKIAAALVRDEGAETPSLYVLDEPTAALNEAESEKLFAVIERLTARGAAVLYVSHRLAEVMRLADEVSVLRNGQLVMSAPVSETDRETVIRQMTGREVTETVPPRTVPVGSAVVARAEGVGSRHLSDISFELREGEILGLAGLADAEQGAVLDLFLGLEKVRTGRLDYGDGPVPHNPARAWNAGIAYVPRERRAEGLMMPMTIRENALLPHLAGLLASRRAERRRAGELGQSVKLKARGPDQIVSQLSGGNQQKVVFARALGGRPRLLLLDEPTRGVDVGAKFEIYSLIRELAATGCAVILSSTDLPELIGLSDRLLILQKGRQVSALTPDGLTQAGLLAACYATDERAA
ncbi:sugar ABC transporter ATP-binding protein [Pelagovum pacificum]|uniref:Sugar ABC transporter ATP-binding protein n=1 Tax=Pelagovum pacificum TaxID=2588711 RepID=A0A5C5GIM5_9RHOB|nr:sugar ABC transporter ATP-binding protein [Pelagovum pacificum]QQA43589.1 sugar ABC transporter ATP-binding protein [Pelagovum pacificum]TNY33276.1 sugar ABC transporter ATP-binding protein [Pelagovum pacificum]